jgi:hypothetical protein
MESALNRVERGSFIALLSEQFGSVMSLEEIEEVALSFQIQIQERLASKTNVKFFDLISFTSEGKLL